MEEQLKILVALPKDIKNLAVLFDAYRVFYGQPTDIKSAESFLQKRMSAQESMVLVCKLERRILGFLQAYESYSSVSMKPILILNDLFVSTKSRGQGIAKLLIEHLIDYAQSGRYARINIATMPDNHAAQRLYESMGFERDVFLHYTFRL